MMSIKLSGIIITEVFFGIKLSEKYYSNLNREENIMVAIFPKNRDGEGMSRSIDKAKEEGGIWLATLRVEEGFSFDAYAAVSSGDPGDNPSHYDTLRYPCRPRKR